MAAKLAKALIMIGTFLLWLYGYIIAGLLISPPKGDLGAIIGMALTIGFGGLFLGLPGLILILVSYILIRREGSKLVGVLLGLDGAGIAILGLWLFARSTFPYLLIAPLLLGIGILLLGIGIICLGRRAYRKTSKNLAGSEVCD